MVTWRGIAENLISTALWVVGAAVVSALAVWFTYLTPAVRAFAPASYFFGGFIALLLFMIVAERGLRLWRQYHPVDLRTAPNPDNLVTEASLIREQLKKAVESLSKVENSIAQMNARLGLVEANVSALASDLDNARGDKDTLRESIQSFMGAALSTATELHEHAAKRMQSLADDIAEIRRGCADLNGTVKENEKHVRESLHAVLAREQLTDLATEIQKQADTMYLRLKAGEVYTECEWDEWTNVEHAWERSLKVWMDTANFYAPNVKRRIMTINDSEYDGEWEVRDKQFPSADAVRRFKRFRIIYRHWSDVKAGVDLGVFSVAFLGQTEQEQHGGQYDRTAI